MSHIVTIETEVRDRVAVEAACRQLGLPPPANGTFRLYGGEVTGLAVQLSGWRYPIVCRTEGGELRYDNFEGRWGAPKELHRFLQRYAIEKARLEAHRLGNSILEQALEDGSVRLTIQIGAGV